MPPAPATVDRRELFRRLSGRGAAAPVAEPELVSEAVRERLRGADASRYSAEAEPAYRLPMDAREAAFAELDLRYFRKLGLAGELLEALEPFRTRLEARRLLVVRAPSPSEEGADLARIDGAEVIRLALLTRRLGEPESLRRFVAHELVHVEDMLDPGFSYRPSRPMPGTCRSERDLARERFRILWGASADARLMERGLAPLRPWEDWERQARQAFPRAEPSALAALLERLRRGERPDHPAMLELAGRPDLGAARQGASDRAGQPCPLCRFTTFEWAEAAAVEAAAARIAGAFPAWSPADGACAQCLTAYADPEEAA
ncbi:MAG TPA: hypothetical protein VFA20_00175 [Myxococcaceae bacterium]|nr:hypothetical protein [Myxococcaceae bacterium]